MMPAARVLALVHFAQRHLRRMIGGQVFRRELGIAADGQQDVVEVMRDAAGHAGQRADSSPAVRDRARPAVAR